MTQQVESQCDQHDAVKSALQIPLPLSHKKHRFESSNILIILSARGGTIFADCLQKWPMIFLNQKKTRKC